MARKRRGRKLNIFTFDTAMKVYLWSMLGFSMLLMPVAFDVENAIAFSMCVVWYIVEFLLLFWATEAFTNSRQNVFGVIIWLIITSITFVSACVFNLWANLVLCGCAVIYLFIMEIVSAVQTLQLIIPIGIVLFLMVALF